MHNTFNTLSNENLLKGIMVGIEKLTGTKLHFYTALQIKLTQLEITLKLALSTELINQIFVYHSPTDAAPQFL